MTGQGKQFPSSASVVIIGGGVMGVSAAFHLAEAGLRDVVLLEKHALGSGSTCKAAGGVRAQFSDELNIALGVRSLQAYTDFNRRPGQEIDLRQVGYLFLLDSAETVSKFEQAVNLQNELGVPSRLISPAEARELSPLIETDGMIAAAFSPSDGYCTPESVVLGYASAARRRDARLITGCAATGIEISAGQVTAVLSEQGRIATETVICTAGAWSREVGEWVDVDLPVTPLRRQIMVTEPIPDLPPEMPLTLDFSTSLYFHNEGQGLLVGMSYPDEQPGFDTSWSDAWLPRLGEAMGRRAPSLLDFGLRSRWAGLYEMTADHNALIGQSLTPAGFLYATGFSGHGFLMAPAVGEILRDLYLGKAPFVDVTPLSADRFASEELRPEMHII